MDNFKSSKQIFILFSILFLAIIFHASATTSEATLTPSEIYQKNKGNVHTVLIYDKVGEVISQGSAVFLFSNYFVTNAHVLENGVSAKLSINGILINTYEVMTSSTLDIAYFAILPAYVKELGLNQIEYSLNVDVASDIFVISSPLGLSQSITQGIISADRDKIIQHTAAISPGSSGGALFDSKGKLLGIVNARSVNDSNISFAIKIEHILSDLIDNNENMLKLYESPPLLSGKALVSMETLEEGAMFFSLIELGTIKATKELVEFVESQRVVVIAESGLWVELLTASRLDCKTKKRLTKTIGVTSFDSNEIEQMGAGESDGQWLDISKTPNKELYENMCMSQGNVWTIKSSLRKIHNKVQPLVPDVVYKPIEID